MSTASIDVIGVGNAIVDVLAEATDAFLAEHAIPKGGMILNWIGCWLGPTPSTTGARCISQ